MRVESSKSVLETHCFAIHCTHIRKHLPHRYQSSVTHHLDINHAVLQEIHPIQIICQAGVHSIRDALSQLKNVKALMSSCATRQMMRSARLHVCWWVNDDRN
jgi:hypothetical protein